MIEVLIVIVLLLVCIYSLIVMEKLHKFIDVSFGVSNNHDKNILHAFWRRVVNNDIYIALFIVFISITIVSVVGLITKQNFNKDFIDGVFIELFGFLFDAMILVLLFTFLKSRRERNLNIENNITLIEELANRNAPAIHARVKTTIQKLNREGKYDLNLSNIFMQKQRVKNIILNGSSLYKVDFSETVFENGKFIKLNCSDSKFFNACLYDADFKNSIIQNTTFRLSKLTGANFSNASLSKVDLSLSHLKNVDFRGAKIHKVNLHHARVEENFFQRIQDMELADAFEINSYNIVTEVIGAGEIYYLERKPPL